MLHVENNLNRSGLPNVCCALFWRLCVPGGGLGLFRCVFLSGSLLLPKRHKRQATYVWPNVPHSKLRKSQKNGLISPKLPHGSCWQLFFLFVSPKVQGLCKPPEICWFSSSTCRFPFLLCLEAYSVYNWLSWQQDLNFSSCKLHLATVPG